MDRPDTKAHKQHSWNAVCGGGRGTTEIFFQPANMQHNMQHAVHGHTGDWAQGLPHAKRMWYHYTMCPWVTALIVSEIAEHAAAGLQADLLS